METIYRPRAEGQRFNPYRSSHQIAGVVRRTYRSVVSTFQRDPRWALWLALWLPFWIGSAAPPPRLGWFRPPPRVIASDDPAAAYLTIKVARVTRTYGRAWFCGSLLRGLAMGLLVLVIWAATAAASSLALPSIPVAIAILTSGIVLGGVHGWLIWPSQAQTLRMLDRTFALRERMVSAFERPASSSRVSRIQLADAANILDEMIAEIPRSSWIPVREVALGLIFAGMLVTIMLAGVSGARITPLNEASVPQFLLASERMAVREQPVQQPPTTDTPAGDQATIADIQQRGRESQQAREDLQKLAEALQPYPITEPVADAITNEDYVSAADMLRTASESAATMDQAEREAMADDLDEAADGMSETNPELAQASRDAANALREGGPDAETALNSLADEVEATGDDVESQESLAQELDEATGNGSSGDQTGNSGESDANEPAGASGSESEGDSQQASDPGEGASADPGVVNQQQEGDSSSSSSGEQGEGSTEEGAGSAASDEASAAQSTGNEGEGDGTSSDQGGNGQQQSASSSDAEGDNASQGSGAGSGQSQTSETSDSSGSGGSESPEQPTTAEEPGTGQAGDPPPGSGQQGDSGSGTTSPGTDSLQLAGTSEESVQSGGDSGTSSTGSGSDSTTTSGDMAGSDPGDAGPDSNRVPPALRDVVRDYFEGPTP